MAKNVVELNIDGTPYTNRPFGTCETAAGTSAKVVTCSDFILVTRATILVKFTYTNTATFPTLNVNSTGAKSIKWNRSTSIGNKIKAGDVYEFIYDGTYWLCLGGMDLNNSVTQIPTTINATYPLLMTMNSSPSTSIEGAVRYHDGLTYNPSTKTLGLSGPIIPNQNSAYDLGTSTNKWNEVHAESFKGTADSARLTPYGVCSTASATVAKEVTTSVPFILETGARISVKFNNTNTAFNMTLNVNNTGDKNVYFNGVPVGTYVISANNVYEFIYDGTNYILQLGVQNTAGSGSSTSKLFLIGATAQSSAGTRTYSNSYVYTKSGAIYTRGGFYDESTATGASVYKAVVPKDYTEELICTSVPGTHTIGGILTTSVTLTPPQCGGLVGEMSANAGSSTTLTPKPTSLGQSYNTTLAITLNTVATGSNYRFVRLLLSVPVTVQNTSNYLFTFNYMVQIRKGSTGTYKTITKSAHVSSGTSATIEPLSIIFDLMKETIVNDTANGITSWV